MTYLIEKTIGSVGNDTENGGLADELVRDGGRISAVSTGTILLELRVDFGPVASSGEVGGDAVQPGGLRVGEGGVDRVAVNMELGGVQTVRGGRVTAAGAIALTIIVEGLDGVRLQDLEVGMSAARKEHQHRGDRSDGRHRVNSLCLTVSCLAK